MAKGLKKVSTIVGTYAFYGIAVVVGGTIGGIGGIHFIANFLI